jgi:hypothetical protein
MSVVSVRDARIAQERRLEETAESEPNDPARESESAGRHGASVRP